VLIGGLTTSMILTLFVVPAAYSLLDSLSTRIANRNAPAPSSPESSTPVIAKVLQQPDRHA
jgi:hypothetical protein